MRGGILIVGPIVSLLSVAMGLLLGASWPVIIALFFLAGPIAVVLVVVYRQYVCTGDCRGDRDGDGKPLE